MPLFPRSAQRLHTPSSRPHAPRTVAAIIILTLSSFSLLLPGRQQEAARADMGGMGGGMAMVAPPNCQITSPAFCDNFTVPNPGGRAGDLNEQNWSFSRLSERAGPGNGTLDAVPGYPGVDEQFCRTFRPNIPLDGDSFFCNNNGQEVLHWMTSVTSDRSGGGYQSRDARIRQPFDFANRTGTIAFNVDAKNIGSADGWVEVWITQDPVDDPHTPAGVQLGATDLKNAVGFTFDSDCGSPQKLVTLGSVDVFSNYHFQQITPTRLTCATTMADMFNHFEIRVSQSSVQVWASDFSPDHGSTFPNFREIASANVSLPFTRGYVHVQQDQFGLYEDTNTSITYHWLGIGFDGPLLPTDRAYDIPDALTLQPSYLFGAPETNLGYLLPANGSSGMKTCCGSAYTGYSTFDYTTIAPFTLNNVDLTNATGATINLSFYTANPCYTTSATPSGKLTLLYRLNGGSWRFYPYPFSDCPYDHWLAMSVPVNLGDLVQGTNTLEFSSYADPNNPVIVANADLTLQGNWPATGFVSLPEDPSMAMMPVPDPYPSVDPSLVGAMSLATSPSASSYNVGDTFSVAINLNGGGNPMTHASATVNIAPNLAVQSLTPGNCGGTAVSYGSYVLTPSAGDPSFAYDGLSGSPTSCTMEKLTMKATAPGTGWVILTSGSIQTKNARELLANTTVESDYTVNGTTTPPNTPTPTPTSTPTPAPLFSDSFEKDAIGSTPSGWTVSGGTWTVKQGSGSDTTQVVSQTNASTSTVMELVAGSSSWTNYTVQADVQAPSSPNSITITARRQDANNNYQFLLKNGNQWYLGGRQSGNWFTLASGSFSYTAGSWYTLKLSVNGTTISGAINGTTVATVSDSRLSSGGFSLRATTTPSYDNVVVTRL